MTDTDECRDDVQTMDTDPTICNWCNGSGEGQHEGTICKLCKGQGEVCSSQP